MNGSQAQLEFLPERSTDFIFAVIGEEFGLLGQLLILSLYGLVIGRALYLAMQGQDTFARLTGGAIALSFFVYVFVNSGMVSGILPVVGVPLADDQLRRHVHGHAAGGLRNIDVAAFASQAHRVLRAAACIRSLESLCSSPQRSRGRVRQIRPRRIDTHRADVKSFIEHMAESSTPSRSASCANCWRAAQSQPAILEAMERPAEKAKMWYEYRPIFLTERRIREGTEFWLAHRQELDQGEPQLRRRSGIPGGHPRRRNLLWPSHRFLPSAGRAGDPGVRLPGRGRSFFVTNSSNSSCWRAT